MRSYRLAMLLVLIFVVATPAYAQGGLTDLFRDDAEPDIVGPAETEVSFPALAGCESGLAGLPPLERRELVERIERRLALWNSATFATVPSFESRAKAMAAHDCFARRIDRLAAFLPGAAADGNAATLAAELDTKFGSELAAFVAGRPPQGDTFEWWQRADSGMELLARIDVALSDSERVVSDNRQALVSPARVALAELARTLADIERYDSVIAEGERAYWLRALAWRALSVGKLVDTLEVADLSAWPEDAYEHLIDPDRDGEDAIPKRVTEALVAVRMIRQNKSVFDPGLLRNWSTPSQLHKIAEELYLVHIIGQTISRRIDQRQAEQNETKRLSLQLDHDVALAQGVPEEESLRARAQEWRSFISAQLKARTHALARWDHGLFVQRYGLMAAAVAYARSADYKGLPR